MSSITNWDDIIDSRDVIDRISQLQALREPGPVPPGVLDPEDYSTDQDTLFSELASLEALARDARDYVEDWDDGVPLIRSTYFQNYVMQLADDLGYINSDVSWPYTCIDWERAANELRMDYTSVDFAGVTYWVR